MDAKEMKFQAQLEEYKQLRAGMMGWSTRSGTYHTILILANAAAIPVGFHISNPVVFLAAGFLTLIVWGLEIRRHRAVQRLGAYIGAVLEKNLSGLRWEKFTASDREKKTNWSYFLSSLPFLCLALFSLGASGSFWFTSKPWMDFPWIWWVISSIFIVVLIVLLVSLFRIYSYRKRMNGFFSSIGQKKTPRVR